MGDQIPLELTKQMGRLVLPNLISSRIHIEPTQPGLSKPGRDTWYLRTCELHAFHR